MPTTDPRVDAYIARAAPFAQPILTHFRALVHRVLPEVEEGIKWSMPAFMLKGKNVAGLAAFKAHCAVMIHGQGRPGAEDSKGEGMGGYGKVTALSDLPGDDVLEASLRDAAERVATTGRASYPRPKSGPKPEIPMPDDFAAALAAQPKAKETLERFAPGQRREYLEWVTTAKQAATRERRIAQAVEWLAEGKRRNWKYESC